MSEILSIQGLTKNYRNVRAIHDLNLRIEEGQAHGILGPNGSGKTTTLSIITGILRQDSGFYRWFGEDPYPAQRKMIGSLIETPHFYPYLSLLNNLKIICDINQSDYSEIDRVLRVTKLYDRRKSKFSTLSLGMKQRMGIASALLGDPKVLVLDEPTNGLDPEGIAEVRELVIQQVEKGKTLILASHILSEVEKICSHVAILKKGELLASGSVKELLSEQEIIEVQCSEPARLHEYLKDSGLTREIESSNGTLILTLNDRVRPEEINAFAFSKNIILSHMVSRSKSLESQFLELVKE
ncbi:MAG: ABC transporter ATP-binding protein [Bacteroidales bacterium]|nr:ABC transporter ATP-binding protein [Bacteroidales bacterium]